MPAGNAEHESRANAPGLDLQALPRERPVLLTGPTASGKSALALQIAEQQGRVIVNADALQVFDGWRVLTARPGTREHARAPHALYGHVSHRDAYSAGDWLRDVAPFLDRDPGPVIVGGTGLYFMALTDGLADLPATDPAIRRQAEDLRAEQGLAALLADLDPETRERIDPHNPKRVQRAWEVARQTGRGLAAWHAETPPPLLPLARASALLIDAPKAWLGPRIARRVGAMLAEGALDEAQRMAADWEPSRQSSQAIGAAELIAVVRGRMTLQAAEAAMIHATTLYAKRQRTWFRRRMGGWTALDRGEMTLC